MAAQIDAYAVSPSVKHFFYLAVVFHDLKVGRDY